MTLGLLDRIIRCEGERVPFALIFRPEGPHSGALEVFSGKVEKADLIGSIDLPDGAPEMGTGQADVLALIPFRQLAERGFACIDDETPLLTLQIAERDVVPLSQVLAKLPAAPIQLKNGRFDIDDEHYADLVRAVIDNEIGNGEGSNFVIKRSFTAQLETDAVEAGFAVFRRLLQDEAGAYWAFLLFTGDRLLVGASPERQVSMQGGVATINPISGTYRYPPSGPSLSGAVDFLADTKERDELYMVVDEELKMMARFCPKGGTVVGPFLKEMSRLAHTEYLIKGNTPADPREVLVHTMFAPTVTGSPLENACRVVAKYEPAGRGYYAGTLALFGRDQSGTRTLDSAILIRTASISMDGGVSLGVGATIVRHSDPVQEASETLSKAKAMLGAFGFEPRRRLSDHQSVQAALKQRNALVSSFWLTECNERGRPDPALSGLSALVVDAEDEFTEMLAQQLAALGLVVTKRSFQCANVLHGEWDLVVMGPGPGNPNHTKDPRIAAMQRTMATLLAERHPFIAVCLSHQILSRELGLEVLRRATPNQGIQREINYFGDWQRVGFYNSYVANCARDFLYLVDGICVEVSRDETTGEVHAMRSAFFSTMQFHPESLLTQDGPGILRQAILHLVRGGIQAFDAPANHKPALDFNSIGMAG
ncbi:anthranilate synthase family protein [Pararhizobium sp. LjRoot235]|uniref:anthranilate synthase family protein n=1 Tax=Pararhizobium sp. LjRoot235 TaxID=3342291 RepID=UPI003ECE6FA4